MNLKLWFLFCSNILIIKKKRRKAGCVFISANNKILFTVNQKEILQAPIGKESSKDGGSLKLTALREGLEETAIYLDQSEFYDNNQFFYHEGVRFYIISKRFEANQINLNHCRLGEIKKLQWLGVDDIEENNVFGGQPFKLILERDFRFCIEKIQKSNFYKDRKLYLKYEKFLEDKINYIKRKIEILGQETYDKK